jgi:S-adenosylmethionine-diacylglycerol 3-amino-3-carboxypropyl transferase
MKSEFYNVALDRIRYSLVWEDAVTLDHALNITSGDNVLIITSAGCNVVNGLLKSPRSVTAIDINPIQNKLLLLKEHIILHHDHVTFRGCLGLDGVESVGESWQKVQATLPENIVDYWSSFFRAHSEGLIAAGKLEYYVTSFYNTLNDESKDKLHQLLVFKSISEQYDYFIKYLHNTNFTAAFKDYFSDQNLSKGRDPKLFKYADESGGEAFYNRLVKQLSSTLVSSNFYFRFFFFGPHNIPEELLPPCYQEQNFKKLKEQLPKLSVVTSEAIDYLVSDAGKNINKASLSNIFEYTSVEEFNSVCRLLYQMKDRKLKIVFWNLLHEQGQQNETIEGMKMTVLQGADSSKSCFYFKDVRVLENQTLTTSQPVIN